MARHLTGFDEEVQLGQLGEILENDSVVMTVEFTDERRQDDPPRRRAPLARRHHAPVRDRVAGIASPKADPDGRRLPRRRPRSIRES